MPNEAPLVATRQSQVDAAAATVDTVTVVCEAPWAASVSRVVYTPSAAITGADTNTRTVAVVNKGAAGSGSTSVASLALVSGVNAAAAVEKAVTLSGTAANLVVAAGDVLEFTSTHAGTGIADPGGQVIIEFTRTGAGS